MSVREDAFFFDCGEASLLGITHVPPRPATLGVMIVVGGPQYRVGSHRQFVLLARALARSGFASMRFDLRGMGDSTGEPRDFLNLEADLSAAIDAFYRRLPGLQGVALWGLCDAASAIACYAGHDARVAAVVLANPWVRTEESHARVMLGDYYRRRVLSAEFWRKLARARLDWRQSAAQLGRALWRAARIAPRTPEQPLPQRMLRALKKRGCPALFILSGNDLVASEFRAAIAHSRDWRAWLASPHVRVESRPEADHTFSTATWRDEVADLTRAWMLDLARSLPT